MTDFPPTRAAALARLLDFAPRAGRDYARLRNFDIPDHPHVSGLSPYLSHRVITEEEVLREILRHHSQKDAEKFIQEVCWRTYWKGVLERRPTLWDQYKISLNSSLNRIFSEAGLRADWEAACEGKTGINAFDSWAHELVQTGYLHNHARMWFASIWIFTLRLPWALGADFFMRHLLDADAASNTLSWRWVAGLQTAGKTYLARPENVQKYTNGRFRPENLAPFATPLGDPELPPLMPVPSSSHSHTDGLLLTEDDLSIDALPKVDVPVIIAIRTGNDGPLQPSAKQREFAKNLAEDCQSRLIADGRSVSIATCAEDLLTWANEHQIGEVSMNHQTVGPMQDMLTVWQTEIDEIGLQLHSTVRPYDATGWTAATAGFFKFKAVIPRLLSALDQPELL